MKHLLVMCPLLPTIFALLPRHPIVEIDHSLGSDLVLTTYTEPKCASYTSAFDISYSKPQTAAQAIRSYNLSRALHPLGHLDFSTQPRSQGPNCGAFGIPCECMLFYEAAPQQAAQGCKEAGGG